MRTHYIWNSRKLQGDFEFGLGRIFGSITRCIGPTRYALNRTSCMNAMARTEKDQLARNVDHRLGAQRRRAVARTPAEYLQKLQHLRSDIYASESSTQKQGFSMVPPVQFWGTASHSAPWKIFTERGEFQRPPNRPSGCTHSVAVRGYVF